MTTTSPIFSVSGLSSGLDTSSIISQLMQIEQQPITALQNRKAQYQGKIDTWAVIQRQLSSLRSSVDGLKRLSDVAAFTTAASSDTDAVTVNVTGSPSAGTLSFTVDQLATRHQLASGGSYASSDALVGAGTLTITVDGVGHDVTTTGTTTVQQLATAISNLGIGVRASVVSVDGSDHRLVLRADESGTANAFTAVGTQAELAAFDVVEDAKDAQLTIGSGGGALVVTRSSNDITDLLDGVTISLKAKSSSPVTITTGADADGLVSAVSTLVDRVNSTLATIDAATKYDAETQEAGPLQGDSSAWSLAMQLRMAVSDSLAQLGGSYRTASSIGITLGRDGQFSLDETRLRDALAADPDAVARLLARSGAAADARLGFVASSDRTAPGSYEVVVTRAAQTATVTGGAYAAPGGDEAFTIASGARSADVTILAGSSLAQAVTQVNDALAAAGIATLAASDDGLGHLVLTESRYGAGVAFTVAGDDAFGLNGAFAGVDAAGTIDGVAATGSGQTLTSVDGDAKGLVVRVGATAAEVAGAGGSLSLGALGYSDGLAGRVSRFLSTTEGATGSVTIATDRWTAQIALIDDEIAQMQERLSVYESTLRAQFTAMENALSNLQAQGQWLTNMFSTTSSSGG